MNSCTQVCAVPRRSPPFPIVAEDPRTRSAWNSRSADVPPEGDGDHSLRLQKPDVSRDVLLSAPVTQALRSMLQECIGDTLTQLMEQQLEGHTQIQHQLALLQGQLKAQTPQAHDTEEQTLLSSESFTMMAPQGGGEKFGSSSPGCIDANYPSPEDQRTPSNAMSNQQLKTAGEAEEPETRKEYLRRIVEGPRFDLAMGLVIFTNLLMMYVHLEIKGYKAAKDLGFGNSRESYLGEATVTLPPVLESLEAIFNFVYLVELAVKLYAVGWSYLCDISNVLDALLVVLLAIDSFVLAPIGANEGLEFLPIMRVLRILRILRVMKIVRLMVAFKELRILLRTLAQSVGCLGWSMVVLTFIILAGGMLIAQLTHGYLTDTENELDQRRWVFESFGTASRASYTMFEATFTGSWFRYSRPSMEILDPAFAFFWITYIVVINFAMMRVVTALFLKQTMAVANSDTNKAQMAKMAEKETFALQLSELFEQVDESCDGAISQAELEKMFQNKEMTETLQKLNLEELEMMTLYRMLKNADGEVNYQELLMGALTMKNSSHVLDTVKLLHNQMYTMKKLQNVEADLYIVHALLYHSLPPSKRPDFLPPPSDPSLGKVEAPAALVSSKPTARQTALKAARESSAQAIKSSSTR